MNTKRPSDLERETAFGAEFRPLMSRIARRFQSRLGGTDPPQDQVLAWREVAALFEPEAEALIAKHRLQGPFAEYVRHVVREGFDVDFDLMDPTPRSEGT